MYRHWSSWHDYAYSHLFVAPIGEDGRAGEATDALMKWVGAGRIAWKADVQQGFENAPKTLLRLYSGANFGKQLLEI